MYKKGDVEGFDFIYKKGDIGILDLGYFIINVTGSVWESAKMLK